MAKKILSLLLIFLLIFTFCSCTEPVRADFSELLIRMNKKNADYVLRIEDAFFSEDQWFLFVEVNGENSILLTAREDENRYITQVGISVMDTGDEAVAVFMSLCEAAGEAFTLSNSIKDFLGKVNFYNENEIFSENAYFAQEDRYCLSFFNAQMGSTVLFQIKNETQTEKSE